MRKGIAEAGMEAGMEAGEAGFIKACREFGKSMTIIPLPYREILSHKEEATEK